MNRDHFANHQPLPADTEPDTLADLAQPSPYHLSAAHHRGLRTGYQQGYWWGLVCGVCATGLAVALGHVVVNAWAWGG